jgi:hypothetical protein
MSSTLPLKPETSMVSPRENGFLQQHQDAGNEILTDIMEGKANGEPQNAQTSEEGGDIYADLLGGKEQCENDDAPLNHAPEQQGNLWVGATKA